MFSLTVSEYEEAQVTKFHVEYRRQTSWTPRIEKKSTLVDTIRIEYPETHSPRLRSDAGSQERYGSSIYRTSSSEMISK